MLRLMFRIVAGLALAITLRADASSLSLPQYVAELQHLKSALAVEKPTSTQVAELTQAIPDVWTIQANGQNFAVPTARITINLRDYQRDSRHSQSLVRARQIVEALLADAQAMSEQPGDTRAERQRLDEILARREFRGVAGETWWDRLKREAQRYILQLLARMISSSAFPVVGRFLIWAVVGLAVALLAYWVIRSYLRSGVLTMLSEVPSAISEKPWRDWQAEATAAAHDGRWRDAIHLSYWAGISFLEGQGLWRPDRARTPREYLRLLPGNDPHRDTLVELTGEFEAAWYGSDQASEQQFYAANTLLERLGCR